MAEQCRTPRSSGNMWFSYHSSMRLPANGPRWTDFGSMYSQHSSSMLAFVSMEMRSRAFSKSS
eukprot:12929322-Heterocapsa_arctica.AAC.1